MATVGFSSIAASRLPVNSCGSKGLPVFVDVEELELAEELELVAVGSAELVSEGELVGEDVDEEVLVSLSAVDGAAGVLVLS